MASVPTSGPPQDLPPKGGFPAFSFKRQLPARGPSGATLFLGTTAVCLTGLLIMGQGNRERRVIKLEKVANRIALVPLLQAEEDRRYLRARAQGQEYEAKIMAGVDGWQVGEKVYHTDRWVPPYMPSPLGKAP
eukprot:comp24576_c0_seq1/m.46785 comp24576_c0_seq1/g.46785  ORF comp24576_c0_seq1/g.46785 comp24576_c0_seq1/m.46785 type:complete len:133 (-) comp24576_c0_seq1:47-445(-)